MSRTNLTLALATTALALAAFAPTMAQASDSFLSRAFTGHHEEGRWINRRLTIRHEGQDAPRFAPARHAHSDGFLSRAFSEKGEKGRWIDRRLTLRHHDQD